MIRWISLRAALAYHREQLAEHGGSDGVRDQGLLESALARPQNLVAYGEPDLADLAAAHGFGIARNHPFVDGNKRTAFVVAAAFLALNGAEFDAEDGEVVAAVLKLAAGKMDEEELAAWFRARIA